MYEEDKKVIMNAVVNGNLKIVQDTLKKHPLVKDRSFFDYQLLKAALCRKHHAITDLLLDKGCRVRNPKEINLEEESLLHLAVKLNNEIIIEKMLFKGASIYDTDHEGNIPICAALQIGHFCAVDEILNHCCRLKDLNPKNDYHVIHFHVALIAQKITSVKLFLAFGFDINGLLNHKVLSCYVRKLQMVRVSLGSNHRSSLNLVKYLATTNWNITILQLEILLNSHKIVQFLLYHGSDINIEDPKGNSVISLINWKHEYNSSLMFFNYAILFGIIFTHVQKLLALKLYVSEKMQNCCNQLYSIFKTALFRISFLCKRFNQVQSTTTLFYDNVYNNCIKELDRMKLTKIDNYTSLYSILLKDSHELSKYARNTSLNDIIDFQNLHKNFPLYSNLLMIQFKKGFERHEVLKFAKESLTRLIGLNLPDLCYDLILKNLTNYEIIDLKSAALLKNKLKRKLGVNNSRSLESKAKLQKQVES